VTRVVGWGLRFRSAPVSDDIRHTLASTRGSEHLAPVVADARIGRAAGAQVDTAASRRREQSPGPRPTRRSLAPWTKPSTPAEAVRPGRRQSASRHRYCVELASHRVTCTARTRVVSGRKSSDRDLPGQRPRAARIDRGVVADDLGDRRGAASHDDLPACLGARSGVTSRVGFVDRVGVGVQRRAPQPGESS
jgi:hypothetical protein